VFEQLYQLASDEIKETAGKLKSYKKTDFDIIITEADAVITANQQDITALEEQEDTYQESRNDLQTKMLQLIETKQPTTYTGPDNTELTRQENTLTKQIDTLQQDIETAETALETLSENIETWETELEQYDAATIQEHVTEYQLKEQLLNTHALKLRQQKELVNAKQEKIDHLATHQYDPNCEYCTSNIFVQNAVEAQNTIDQDRNILNGLQESIDGLSAELKSLKPAFEQQSALKTLQSKIDTARITLERNELQLQILESDLQTRESELETCLERQESFRANESAISHNRQIDSKIAACKSEIEVLTQSIKTTTDTIRSKHGKIEVAKTTKQTAIESLDTYKQLETEYKAYEYYLESVKRDGVPYELISKAMPKIEAEINNVLNQVVDFNMVLQSDGKNINGYIIYDEDNFWPLELTSGMERFISSLAIRIALINVSALPRPNFIAIDEGWGSLDAEHISAVVNLFDYFRTKFDFSVIISHVDSMRDMVDNLIEVNKLNGYSQISHT
jgi:DNA repair exonuclease SbcCD ATPase subunit